MNTKQFINLRYIIEEVISTNDAIGLTNYLISKNNYPGELIPLDEWAIKSLNHGDFYKTLEMWSNGSHYGTSHGCKFNADFIYISSNQHGETINTIDCKDVKSYLSDIIWDFEHEENEIFDYLERIGYSFDEDEEQEDEDDNI